MSVVYIFRISLGGGQLISFHCVTIFASPLYETQGPALSIASWAMGRTVVKAFCPAGMEKWLIKFYAHVPRKSMTGVCLILNVLSIEASERTYVVAFKC